MVVYIIWIPAMVEQTWLGKQFWNVIKVFGVAVAVYLALTVKVDLIWEWDEVTQFDYFDGENVIENTVVWNEIEGTEMHWTSSVFSKICEKYSAVCGKISWSWTFSDENKSIKVAYVAYLLKNLDSNIKRWSNPSQALSAMLINEKKWNRRGSANWDTITINNWWIQYDNEFFQVISHEIWHIIDLWGLQWRSVKKSKVFTEFNKEVFSIDDPSIEYYKYSWTSEKVRKNLMTREDFCSGYWMSDPFEDFAECHNLYLNHHDYFHHIALANDTVRSKYNFFSNLYGWKYINNSDAKYENWSDSYRAWDTTKLREW